MRDVRTWNVGRTLGLDCLKIVLARTPLHSPSPRHHGRNPRVASPFRVPKQKTDEAGAQRILSTASALQVVEPSYRSSPPCGLCLQHLCLILMAQSASRSKCCCIGQLHRFPCVVLFTRAGSSSNCPLLVYDASLQESQQEECSSARQQRVEHVVE